MIPQDVREGLSAIIEQGYEPFAIRALVDSLQNKHSATLADQMDARASLRAIKKLNAGKNDAIDALCEDRCGDG